MKGSLQDIFWKKILAPKKEPWRKKLPSSLQSGDGGNTNDRSLTEITGSPDDSVESLN